MKRGYKVTLTKYSTATTPIQFQLSLKYIYIGLIERRSSLNSHEEDIFLRVFDDIINQLQTNPEFREVSHTAEWIKKVLLYNVPHGKQIR
jgi:hypothetical protein